MRDSFYDSTEWRELSEFVVERDGSRCTVGWLLGGACSGSLQAHHIFPRRERPDLELDPENCGTACAHHHPRWEALRRSLVRERERIAEAPRCGHRHPYKEGREACERRRARALAA